MFKKNEKGFSLVEALVVLGIMTLAFVPLMMGLRQGIRHFTEETLRAEITQETRKSMDFIVSRIRAHNRNEIQIENDYDGSLDRLTVGNFRYYINDDVLVEEYTLDGNTTTVELNKFITIFQISEIDEEIVAEEIIINNFIITLGSSHVAFDSHFQIDTEIYLRGD